MKRQSVESSNISSVGYDPKRKVLEIGFKSGAIYDYEGVPVGIYNGLMDATSKGTYFSQNIRTHFNYTLTKPTRKDRAEGKAGQGGHA